MLEIVLRRSIELWAVALVPRKQAAVDNGKVDDDDHKNGDGARNDIKVEHADLG